MKLDPLRRNIYSVFRKKTLLIRYLSLGILLILFVEKKICFCFRFSESGTVALLKSLYFESSDPKNQWCGLVQPEPRSRN
jgi:hypothetical protein